MSKSLARFKHYLLAACLVLPFGLAGCSSDRTTAATSSSSTNVLPQPEVNCGGSSCVDKFTGGRRHEKFQKMALQ